MTIFSPVEDSTQVICLPPVRSLKQGFRVQFLKENCLTDEDIPACVKRSEHKVMTFAFDKVINDSYNPNPDVKKLYNNVVRPKLGALKNKQLQGGLSVILFGPSAERDHQLLQQSSDQNVALRCVSDLLAMRDHTT